MESAIQRLSSQKLGALPRYADGGPIKGPGTSTSDDIPIMASKGEYMVKAKAVQKLGVPFMEKLNAIADKPGAKASKPKEQGAIRKMAQGGLLDDKARFVRPARAPQMLANQSNPTSAAMVANGRNPVNPIAPPISAPSYTTSPGAAPATNRVPFVMPPEPIAATTSPGAAAPRPTATPAAAQYVAPSTAEAPPRPITGGPTIPGTAPAQVSTPVARVAYNPANASPEAKAYLASRAAPPVAPVAAPAQPGQIIKGMARNAGAAMVAGAGGALLANQTRDIGNPASQPAGPAVMDPLMAQIPTGGIPGAGPTPATQPYNFYTDNEAGRNIGNLMSAASAVPGLGAVSKLARTAAAGAAAVQGFGAQVRTDRENQTAVAPAAPVAAPSPIAQMAAGAGRANTMGQGYDDQRRVDMDPSRQSLGASRDFTNELGAVPRNLPADLQQGVIYKTMGPNGNPVYSGSNVGPNAQMVDGKGATMAPRGGVTTLDMSEGRAQVSRELARIEAEKAKVATRMDEQELAAQMQAGNKGAVLAIEGRMKRAAAGQAAEALASTTGETQKLARDKFNLDATGAALDNKGKARLGALQEALFNAKNPKERADAAEKLRTLLGKNEPQDRLTVARGGQRWDPVANAMVNEPDRVFSNTTGQEIAQQGPKTIATDPRAMEIRDNKAMSREQKVAALKQLGYQ